MACTEAWWSALSTLFIFHTCSLFLWVHGPGSDRKKDKLILRGGGGVGGAYEAMSSADRTKQ